MRELFVRSSVVLAMVVFASPTIRAQDLRVRGGSSTVFSAENNTTTASDKIAVSGTSTPVAFYGIGGSFSGGYIGVKGYASMTPGTGGRYGGFFYASSGSSYNYGIYSGATGPSGSSTYAGYFAGNVYVQGTVTQTSDERLKLNIQDLTSSLDKVRRLKPKTYTFKRDTAATLSLPEGTRHGFLAQDVREVLPDLVKEVPVSDQATGGQKGSSPDTVLSVNYIELIPILVSAVQEQQTQIDELKAKVAQLEAR